MRMLLDVTCPHEPFNTAVRKGTVGEIIKKILEAIKPEAVYFTEQEGRRGAILVVNIDNPSQIPALAEPWFLAANARVEFFPVMRPEDLAKAGPSVEAAVKKYG